MIERVEEIGEKLLEVRTERSWDAWKQRSSEVWKKLLEFGWMNLRCGSRAGSGGTVTSLGLENGEERGV